MDWQQSFFFLNYKKLLNSASSAGGITTSFADLKALIGDVADEIKFLLLEVSASGAGGIETRINGYNYSIFYNADSYVADPRNLDNNVKQVLIPMPLSGTSIITNAYNATTKNIGDWKINIIGYVK